MYICKKEKGMSSLIQSPPPFSNLQMELLKIFDRHLSDEELLEIKMLLAKHFLEKASNAADKVWENNKWTAADAIKLSKEHHRTPYKSETL